MQRSSEGCSNPRLRSLATAGFILGLFVSAVGCDSNSTSEKPAIENAEKTQDEATAEQAEKSAKETAEKAKQAAGDKSDKSEFSDAPKGKKDKPDLPADMPAGTTKHFGAEFQSGAEPITLATAMKKHVNRDEPVKVAASIKKVCKKKGCWFTLSGEDVDRKVRVRMKDYGFFVPMSIMGKTARVEGTLEKVELSLEQSKHLVQDAGGDPSTVTEPIVEYQFVASGVEVQS